MAVDNTSASSGPYTANGVTTVFPFSFIAGSASEVTVLVNDEVLDPTRYVVALDSTGAGNVTIAPPVASGTVYIESNPNFTQTTSFQRFGPYFPDFVNKPLDRSAVRDIYLLDRIKRALVVPRGWDLIGYIRMLVGPGPKGEPGVNGGIGTSAGNAALFGAANGMVIGTGITAFVTSGYATPGLGGARYIYDAAVNAAFVTANPRAAFLAADGRGFRLDPYQTLRASMFGARADYTGNPATATDNYDALMAAMAFRAPGAVGYGSKIHLDWGKYYTSKTLNPGGYIDLEGAAIGVHGTGAQAEFAPTWLVAPTNVTVIRLKSTAQSNAFSRLSNMVLSQVTQGNDLSAHGVHATCSVFLKSLSYVSIAGDGERIEAWIDGTFPISDPRWGEASNWVSEDNFAHSVGGNGHYARGADTNIGRCVGFQTQVCGLCGIRDNSYYTNIYMQCHLAGYGTGGVQYNGRRWQAIADSLNVPPGTNRPSSPWYDRGPLASPTTAFPAWNSAITYSATGPVIATNAATFVGIYVEGEGAYGSSHAPIGIVHGPNMGWTHYTRFSGVSPTGVGMSRGTGGDPAHPAYPSIGEGEQAIIGYRGDDRPITQRSALLFMNDGVLGQTLWDWENENSALVLRRMNQPEFLSLIYGPKALTGSQRNAPNLNQVMFNGFSLKETNNSNNIINVQVRGAAPTTGEWRLGDRVMNANPTLGGVDYWICVQSGALSEGPWTSGEYPLIGNVRQSDGKAWVLIKRSATGQVFTAPTGATTFVDAFGGATWQPVTQPFVFKAVMVPA